MIDGVRFEFVPTNGVQLHVAKAGPPDGPLVILLHGFPEFWYAWRHQIPRLVAEGFQVWAPDQRGYNLSDKPLPLKAYSVDQLATDVVGLIDAAGKQRATVVGHDWGGGVAWWVGVTSADRLDKLVVLNVPHGAVMQRYLRTSLRQIMKSWYIFLFQLPWLPEKMLMLRKQRLLRRSMQKSSRAGVFTEEDLLRYQEAWTRPGAIQAMVNWYRALVRRPPEVPGSVRIKTPTLLIWGAGDRFLGREMAAPSIDLCDDGRLVFLEEASHWVQQEEPDAVNDLIVQFLSE